MSHFLFSAFKFIQYVFKRKDEHALHSPFLFDFYKQTVVLRKESPDPEIETLRQQCLRSELRIAPSSFGAGSRSSKSRVLRSIARRSLSPARQNVFFASVLGYMKAQTVLELGTSLGINTAYLGKADPALVVYTLEGDPEIVNQAKQHFASLELTNVHSVIGDFDLTLPSLLEGLPSLDFVFFDGNHKYEPTLRYFEMCLPKAHEASVFVFHDIYWSPEMSKAWQAICSRLEVTLSIDFFYFGIVFFRTNQPKQHFVLKF